MVTCEIQERGRDRREDTGGVKRKRANLEGGLTHGDLRDTAGGYGLW